jgi:hypothetical protein
VKFRNNPQHHRVLVNELLSATFLDYLKISIPETAIVHVTKPFLEANPEIHIALGTRRIAIEPGWHFGSRYPGDPARSAVYDFLPDALLSRVVNLEDFAPSWFSINGPAMRMAANACSIAPWCGRAAWWRAGRALWRA